MFQDDALYGLRRRVKGGGAGIRIIPGSVIDGVAEHPAHSKCEIVARAIKVVLKSRIAPICSARPLLVNSEVSTVPVSGSDEKWAPSEAVFERGPRRFKATSTLTEC